MKQHSLPPSCCRARESKEETGESREREEMRGVREPHKEQTGERRAIEEMRGGDRKINESGLASHQNGRRHNRAGPIRL